MSQGRMAWRITSNEASYTCTNCSWKIVFSRENGELAAEAFDRHDCADHPPLKESRGKMRNRELTPEQIISVPCPTCGVPAGERCVLHSGSPRSGPHIDRRFDALEAIEKKSG
jgi:predicted RNA-binding Zn-ribbon protein involved in translation (DUF1610 family)